MKRTQIYLTEEQHDFVETLAFIMSKKINKKISISEIIRIGIVTLKAEYAKYQDDPDFLFSHLNVLEDFEKNNT